MSLENKKMHPFISIVICCYNYGHLLGRALNICAEQSFQDFEIILVNDGSTDNTEAVYQDFCRKNLSVSTEYVHVQPNKGLINARHEGIKRARGEYIMFHDADDYMEPDCLKLLAQKAIETGADRVMGQYQEVLPDGTVYRVRAFGEKNTRFLTMNLHGVIFRRAVILEHQLFVPETARYAEDVWFTYNFAIVEQKRGQIVRKTVFNYYIYPESIMAMNASDLEKLYYTSMVPYIEIVKNAFNKTKDAELRAEMEYILLRTLYSSFISAYQNCDKRAADQYYLRVRSKLRDNLPMYYRNSLLWNLNNGCVGGGIMPSLACLVISVLDRLQAKGMIRIIALLGRNGSLVKKNVANTAETGS